MDRRRIPLWTYMVFAMFIGWIAWTYAAVALSLIAAAALGIFDVHLSGNAWNGTIWVGAIVVAALLIWGFIAWRRQRSSD